ncbi:MAG: extracellular solute-binding protein [Bacteroidetes bacterium]|nr:extracellular solute-binding protein [Bacteroidota bacterium]
MPDCTLYGITWGHTRGITPLLAAAQRFGETHPGVDIQWKKRTLQEFADFSILALTKTYDLLIVDHPWAGCAAATGCVLPLDEYLPTAWLADQAAHSVGESHASYYYKGHQWALAIDAATPAASYRPDLLAEAPDTWEELMMLAKQGRVAIPAIPIDLLMNFYMFCIAHGQTPFQNEEDITDKDTGVRALETMRELYSLVDKRFFSCNPIGVAEIMSTTNDYWYCPFAYCYSNYSRPGFARYLLRYADLVHFGGTRTRLRSTIGGTGIAVSAASKQKELAVEFAQWVTSPLTQATLYTDCGGQPGHRTAWTSARANAITNDFFSTLLPVMDRGYMRPRYNGYLHFQDHAGDPLQEYLRDGGSAAATLEKMNKLYRASIRTLTHHT